MLFARLLILLPLVVAAYIGKTQPLPNLTVNLPLPPAIEQSAFTEKELKCAADMVLGEAGGEPFAGQVAAAAVAIRRSLSAQWPFDLCSVVREPNQFYGYAKRRKTDEQALASVRYAVAHLGDFPEAYYFHRKEIKGNYAFQYTIGNHTFYRKQARSHFNSGNDSGHVVVSTNLLQISSGRKRSSLSASVGTISLH
jgi:hypothetical protein